jgi:hypothetical protein
VKKVLLLFVATAMSVSLAGCFQNPIETAIEKATEQAVEKALEESGVEVDIDVDGGQGVSLPSNWPSDIPVPAGKIFAASQAEGFFTVVIEVAGEADALAGVEAVKTAGYAVMYEQSVEGMSTWGLEKDGTVVTYVIVSDNESTTVSMTVGAESGY